MRLQLAGCLLVGAILDTTQAQRPSSQSICDYYATKRYGANNITTQQLLMQSIVSLAYAGGSELSNALSGSAGIFNHGQFKGQDVFLRPWFDGSKPTTNLNDQPVGVDWLDGGGTQPLIDFITGKASAVALTNQTNQYRLFNHWFIAFGYTYGCSLVSKFPRTGSSSPVGVAYTHKYMNLNQTDVGYFINQLTLASKYYGFSDDDAGTLETFMNARYNVRCGPSINGQLYSICLADECPLAAPSPDCNAYTNLQPNSASNSTGSPSSSSTSTTTPSSTSSSTSSSAATSSGPVLSSGAIAGIAIGGAAIILLAFGMWLYHRRQKAKPTLVPVPVTTSGHASPASTNPYYGSRPDSNLSPSAFRESYMRENDSSMRPWGNNPSEISDQRHTYMSQAHSPSPKPYDVTSFIAEMPSGDQIPSPGLSPPHTQSPFHAQRSTSPRMG
ncbi:hypothetical protein NLG97_g2719 [Lecanicillium saksenae]|uniref:Uncharacterized protein n=1 Tax=Lecanicillium saksenae TaxID=468837 RepID=A0ACC1R1V8_9HYPO|nr:hypothetical protein NLG97_g2719 [Lecanicillium saksenae]